jgi:ATP-dependent Zn protease
MEDSIGEVHCSHSGTTITFNVGDKTINEEYIGAIDHIRMKNRKDKNFILLRAVHEVGHVLLHQINYNKPPEMVACNIPSDGDTGYTIPSDHTVYQNRNTLRKFGETILGGVAAERLIFGIDHATSGCSTDLKLFTSTYGDAYKKGGLYIYNDRPRLAYRHSCNAEDAYSNLDNRNRDDIDEHIEGLAVYCFNTATDHIKNNIKVFLKLVDLLVERETLYHDDLVKFFTENNFEVKDENREFIDLYEKFKGEAE